MLEEAVGLIRELWKGDYHTHRGSHYTVEQRAHLHAARRAAGRSRSRPRSRRPPSSPGGIGDALIAVVAGRASVVEQFRAGRRRRQAASTGRCTVCWRRETRPRRSRPRTRSGRTPACEGAARPGAARCPAHFEQAAADCSTEDDVAETVVCGPDPEPSPRADPRVRARPASTHVYVHQVGPDQEGFLRFCADEICSPGLSRWPAPGAGADLRTHDATEGERRLSPARARARGDRASSAASTSRSESPSTGSTGRVRRAEGQRALAHLGGRDRLRRSRFVFIVVGRSELFTENFLVPIAGLDRRPRLVPEAGASSGRSRRCLNIVGGFAAERRC